MRYLRLLAPLLVFLATTASTCEKKPDPILPTDTADCSDACDRLRELHCTEGEPAEDGTPCEIFCVDTQTSGYPLSPSCVKSIKACSEVDECVGH